MVNLFLTAEWRRLAIVTFEVPDEVLAPVLPPGTVPDRWEGAALASVVAFEFERTSVLGIPALIWRRFPEWNLRCYVREADGPARRGVAFVKELVPSRLVAAVARGLYNEPYAAVPYGFERRPLGESVAVEHRVTFGGREHRLGFVAGGEPAVPAESTLAHFLKEQEWGFGRSRAGERLVYRVEHPRWGIYPETRFDVDADFGALYGPAWRFLDRATPVSRIVAEGSAVRVLWRGTG